MKRLLLGKTCFFSDGHLSSFNKVPHLAFVSDIFLPSSTIHPLRTIHPLQRTEWWEDMWLRKLLRWLMCEVLVVMFAAAVIYPIGVSSWELAKEYFRVAREASKGQRMIKIFERRLNQCSKQHDVVSFR